MADENAQVQTETSPASTAGETETTPTPVVETAAPVSTTSPVEELSNGSGKVAGGVEGYSEMKDRMMREATKKPAEAAPTSQETSPAPSAETAEEVVAPTAGEETTTTETPASTTETPTGTVDDEENKTPDRIRIASIKGNHLVSAAVQIAREEGISFDEAYERVRPKQPEVTAPAQPASNLRPRAMIEAELATAKQERRAAAVKADALEQGASTRLVDAVEQIETLERELDEVSAHEANAETEREERERTAFSNKTRESKARAVQYYPESGQDGTDFSKRMIELSDQYENDPVLAHHVYEADAPFFFAELVAKEMGMAPAHLRKKKPVPASNGQSTQPSTPTATKPAAVTQRAVVRPVQPAAGPASGSARTTQEAVKPDFGVDNIKSVTDYEKVKDKALGKTR